MKKSLVVLTSLFCLALFWQPALADSLVLTVSADTTFAGMDGVIIQEVFVEENSPPEIVDFGAFPETGKLRIYGFRPLGGAWEIMPSAIYLVQLSNLTIGDSWVGFPSDDLGSTTATVEAIESVTVLAGTFDNAYRVDTRADALGPESLPLESHWYVWGVGFVLNEGYYEDGSIEYRTQLVGFFGTGTGFFPTEFGNSWLYEETPGTITAVGDDVVPAKATLVGAYPNPFNPQTRIVFDLAAPGEARVQIYDTSGRLVRTLINEYRASGRHEVPWNGKDQAGQSVAAGVYLYRLETQGYTTSKHVTLVK